MAKKKGARPGKTVYDVTAEQFIQVWQTSASAQGAADRLGMPKGIAHARASTYRQAGIKLKKMPRHNRRELDVEGLNRVRGEAPFFSRPFPDRSRR